MSNPTALPLYPLKFSWRPWRLGDSLQILTSKMKTKRKLWSGIISLGLLAAIPAGATATEMPIHANQFRRIEQPLGLKVGVTLGGLALIGAELWWFLHKKPKVQQAETQRGIQEIAITVDGGYQPDYIVVHAGLLVRLNFFRKDANSCLEEVLLPDFGIDAHLPVNKTVPVEFTPQKPGEYQFTCGMRMFRGIIEVRPSVPAVD
jgi:plastocyanin domain-containing protein